MQTKEQPSHDDFSELCDTTERDALFRHNCEELSFYRALCKFDPTEPHYQELAGEIAARLSDHAIAVEHFQAAALLHARKGLLGRALSMVKLAAGHGRVPFELQHLLEGVRTIKDGRAFSSGHPGRARRLSTQCPEATCEGARVAPSEWLSALTGALESRPRGAAATPRATCCVEAPLEVTLSCSEQSWSEPHGRADGEVSTGGSAFTGLIARASPPASGLTHEIAEEHARAA